MTRLSYALSHTRAIVLLALAAFVLLAVMAFSQYQVVQSGVSAGGNAIDGRSLVNTGKDIQCATGSECGPNNPAIKTAPNPVNGPKVKP
jgi:hypothetical protein